MKNQMRKEKIISTVKPPLFRAQGACQKEKERMGEPEDREKSGHCPHTVAETVSAGPAKNRPIMT